MRCALDGRIGSAHRTTVSARFRLWLCTTCLLLLSACGHSDAPPAEENVVNVYNWFDYIDPGVLKKFEARYGVKVNYTTFDSDNTLAARLLAGHSGFDVVFPSGTISRA